MSELVFLYRSTPNQQREAMGTPERAQRSLQAYLAWIRTLEAGGHLEAPGQPFDVEARDLDDATELAPRAHRPHLRARAVGAALRQRSRPRS